MTEPVGDGKPKCPVCDEVLDRHPCVGCDGAGQDKSGNDCTNCNGVGVTVYCPTDPWHPTE